MTHTNANSDVYRERMALEEVEDPHHLKITEYGEDASAVEMLTKKVSNILV
jgi:hypothetical protein